MILETERLYLRPFETKDLDMLVPMYSNINVMRFIGTGKTLARTQAEKSIAMWNEYEKKNGFSNWAIIRKEDNAFIGKCGLSRLPDESDIEISYILDEPYWGMGYATEISKAVLEYGFNRLNFKRIVAMAYPQNSPSIKVIEKIGMKYEKEAEYWGIKFLFYSIEKA
jgi:RimJ/RimL family protein N-acetyltransferase